MGAQRNILIGVAWLFSLGVYIGFDGVPWSRDQIAVWLLAPILALTVANRSRSLQRTLADWLPLLALLLTYDLIRGAADEINPTVHVTGPLNAEAWLFAGTIPTVWLQEHFLAAGQPQLHDYLTWLVYLSHFAAALVVAAALWWLHYARFAPFARRVVATTLGAFIGYVAYPAAPPWYAAREGLLPELQRHTWTMWNHVGLEPAATIWQGGSAYANDVAAVPSLHAAYPALFLLFFWGSGWPARIGLAAYALAMGAALVYGAEHYVVDLIAGWLLAGAVHVVVGRLEQRSTGPPPSDPQKPPAPQSAAALQ